MKKVFILIGFLSVISSVTNAYFVPDYEDNREYGCLEVAPGSNTCNEWGYLPISQNCDQYDSYGNYGCGSQGQTDSNGSYADRGSSTLRTSNAVRGSNTARVRYCSIQNQNSCAVIDSRSASESIVIYSPQTGMQKSIIFADLVSDKATCQQFVSRYKHVDIRRMHYSGEVTNVQTRNFCRY